MLFGLMDKEIQIGVNLNLPVAARHGVAAVQTKLGIKNVPFTVDRPRYLKNPSLPIVAMLFHQFRKLSLPAETIEIRVGKRCRVYRFDNAKPVLIQTVSI